MADHFISRFRFSTLPLHALYLRILLRLLGITSFGVSDDDGRCWSLLENISVDLVVDVLDPGLANLSSTSPSLAFAHTQGITRDSRHKRSASGARRAQYRKKRKFELGRQPAMTKLGAKRIHEVRVRGGNTKYRAMRLDSGNFAWGSEHCTRKTRVIDVVSPERSEGSLKIVFSS